MTRTLTLIAALSACGPDPDALARNLRAWRVNATTHNYIAPTEANIVAALERMNAK